MRVLTISGSLRPGSYNTLLLRAAEEQAPAGIELIASPAWPTSPTSTATGRLRPGAGGCGRAGQQRRRRTLC